MSDPNTRTKRRQTAILVCAVAGIIGLVVAGMILLDGPPPVRREKPRTVNLTPPGTVDDRDMWRQTESARAKNAESSIGELQRKMKQQEDDNKRLAKEMDELKLAAKVVPAAYPIGVNRGTGNENASRVLDRPLPAPANRGGTLDSASFTPVGSKGSLAASTLNAPINGGQPAPGHDDVEMISFGAPQPAKPNTGVGVGVGAGAGSGRSAVPKSGEEDDEINLIPAGSFVRVVMLNGVDAPTGGQAQNNPLPIAFNVEDTANLANKHRLDIRDCRIIAAAWGDISSERTMARTETLSCIINGIVAEMPIKGSVIGEDGKAGIRGRLVTKQGQLLANALFAGSLAGVGRAFQSAAATTTTGGGGVTEVIDPNKVAQAGIGGGVGQAGTMLAQYYLKAADKLFPVLETDGGRVVEILITKGAVYTGKAGSGNQYKALMRRHGAAQRSDDDD